MDNIDYSALTNKNIYLGFLKASANNYGIDRCDNIEFEYDIDEEDQKQLSSFFDFSILVDVDELSTFTNAVNWVSENLLSKKSSDIKKENSFCIINNVIKGEYAANCYAHAVVLNDIFRLLGYKARYIFCMPIDYHFADNHVVNLVFSKKEKRWMMFDAAQNLYYTDDNGKVMDIRTFRNYLIRGENINVNLLPVYWASLNDNRERMLYFEKVLIYMSKNMYRFACFKNGHKDRLAQGRVVEIINLVPNTYIDLPEDVNKSVSQEGYASLA